MVGASAQDREAHEEARREMEPASSVEWRGVRRAGCARYGVLIFAAMAAFNCG